MTLNWLSMNAPKLARVSFILYIFFLFFGTSLPFQDAPADLQDMEASNLFNQIVFSALYLASFLSLLPERQRILQLVRKEIFLTLFLVWSLGSVSWSDFGFVSFKRWVQFLGMTVVFSAALIHREAGGKILDDLRAVLLLYIPVSILAVLLVPGAIETDYDGAWRGLTSQKNTLGQVGLASLILWTVSFREDIPRNRIGMFLLWCMSFALLAGSRSMTSLLAAGILLSLAMLLHAERTILRPVAGKLLSSLIVISFFLSPFLLIYLESAALESIVNMAGKDMTFTSRVDIWENVLADAKRHLFFGCGFEGYWVAGNPRMDLLYKDLPWVINQAHMGYLDILNETGLVGLALFALMLVQYLKELLTHGESEPLKWFFLAALIINLQESTLFRLHLVNGALFILAYLALFTGAVRRPSLPEEA